METGNVFLALAEAMIIRGEDGAMVASELADALAWTVIEGVGIEKADDEIARLVEESKNRR